MTTLATMVVKLVGDIGGFSQSLDQAQQKTKSFSASITSAFGDIGRIAGGFVIGNAISAGLGKVADVIGDVKSAMIDGNAEFERYQVQFGVLLGSTDAAQQRLKELADFGARTPFELPEVVRADKILQSFGLHALDSAKRFGKGGAEIRTIAGDVAAGTGASFEEIAGYLGKFSAGATGEAIARFQELGITTRKELSEMGLRFSKSGELLSPLDESMTVLLKSMQNKFGGMMDAQSSTFEGMASNLKDWMGQAGRTIGKPIFEKLKTGMKGLLDFLGSPQVQATLESVANGIATFVEKTMGAVQDFIDGATVTGGFDLFQGLANAFYGLAGTDVASVFQGIGDALLSLSETVQPIIDQVFGWLVTNGPSIGQGLINGFQSAYNSIQPIIASIQTVVSTIFNAVRDFLVAHGEEITTFVQNTWNTIAGIFEGLRGIVETVWGAIATFISNNQEGIRSVIEGVWLAIKLFVGTVLEAIRGVVNAVLALLHGDVAGAFEALRVAVENIWNGLKDTVAKAVESVRMLLLIAWAAIKTAVENAWNGIKTALETAWNSIKSAAETAWNNVKTAIENAINNIVSFLQSLPGKFLELGKAIITGLWEGIKSMFADIGKGISDFFQNTIDDIKKKLGVQSPSKVFAGIGVNLMQGLALGIERGAAIPQLALDGVALNAAGGYAFRGAGASTVSHIANTTYNVTADRAGMEVLLDQQRRAQQAAFAGRM